MRLRHLLPLAALLLAATFAPSASAATIDLAATRSSTLLDATTITGDVNGPAVTVLNRSMRSTAGSVSFDVSSRARFLGVISSSNGGGSLKAATCERTAIAGGAEHISCAVTFPAGRRTLVVATVGVAAPGGASITFLATPGLGDRDPSPRDARSSSSWRASGRTCTVLGASGAFGGAAGSETITGTAGDDVICGFGGRDACRGSFFGTVACTGYSPDIIQAGDGDDVVLLPSVNSTPGATGGDTVDLGAGTDTIVNADSLYGDARAELGAAATLAHRHGRRWVTHHVASAEAYEGSPGRDTVRGTADSDLISGGGGDDELDGLGGDDLLLGGSGEDLLIGGPGFDRLDGGTGGFDAAGAGTTGGSVVDLVRSTITSGGETDSLIAVEGAIGTPGADTLIGNAKTNTFYASAGIDSVAGGGGIDVLSFERVAVGVKIDAATGISTMGAASRTTSRGIEAWVGSRFADTFRGTSGIDVFDAMAGSDLAEGLDGDDVLTGGAGNDTLRGGNGVDELTGDAGRDRLDGGLGRDRCLQDPGAYLTDC